MGREKNPFPGVETCKHGNIPEGCAQCKLDNEEAAEEALTLRAMSGQGITGAAKAIESGEASEIPKVRYEASSDEYKNLSKWLDGRKDFLKQRAGLSGKALNALEFLLASLPAGAGIITGGSQQAMYDEIMEKTRLLEQELNLKDKAELEASLPQPEK